MNEFQQLEYKRIKNLLGEMRELRKLRKSLSSWVSETCRYLEWGLATVAETKLCVQLACFQWRSHFLWLA